VQRARTDRRRHQRKEHAAGAELLETETQDEPARRGDALSLKPGRQSPLDQNLRRGSPHRLVAPEEDRLRPPGADRRQRPHAFSRSHFAQLPAALDSLHRRQDRENSPNRARVPRGGQGISGRPSRARRRIARIKTTVGDANTSGEPDHTRGCESAEFASDGIVSRALIVSPPARDDDPRGERSTARLPSANE